MNVGVNFRSINNIAAQNSAGKTISTTNVAQDVVQMTANESFLSANVKVIQIIRPDGSRTLFNQKVTTAIFP